MPTSNKLYFKMDSTGWIIRATAKNIYVHIWIVIFVVNCCILVFYDEFIFRSMYFTFFNWFVVIIFDLLIMKIFQEPTCRFIPANTVYVYLGAHIRRKEGRINHYKFPSYHKHNCHKKHGDWSSDQQINSDKWSILIKYWIFWKGA